MAIRNKSEGSFREFRRLLLRDKSPAADQLPPLRKVLVKQTAAGGFLRQPIFLCPKTRNEPRVIGGGFRVGPSGLISSKDYSVEVKSYCASNLSGVSDVDYPAIAGHAMISATPFCASAFRQSLDFENDTFSSCMFWYYGLADI